MKKGTFESSTMENFPTPEFEPQFQSIHQHHQRNANRNGGTRDLAAAQIFRNITRPYIFDRALELWCEQVIPQVYEVFATGGFVGIERLFKCEID